MSVIVTQDRATMDAALREIAATPFGNVWCWYDPDGPENTIQYAQAADGRCAISHPWQEEDADWLAAYLAGWAGVTIHGELPPDWVWPTETMGTGVKR